MQPGDRLGLVVREPELAGEPGCRGGVEVGGECRDRLRQGWLVERGHDRRPDRPVVAAVTVCWCQLRQHFAGQPRFGQQQKRPLATGPLDHSPQLGRDPFRADRGHEVGHPLDGRPRLPVEHEIKKGREADRP